MVPERDHHRSRLSDAYSAFKLAGRFVLPLNRHLRADDAAWSRARLWLPMWGLLIGIAYAAIFRIVWFWLGEYHRIRLAPTIVLVALHAAFFGYRLLEGAAQVVATRARPVNPRASDDDLDPPPTDASAVAQLPVMLLLVLAVLGEFALLVSLPAGAVPYPAGWREHLGIAYPYVIYRPLMLMPLWGRWAVMLASGIGRSAPDASQRFKRLAAGGSLGSVLACWAGATALTVMYCSPKGEHIAWSMLISLGMLLVAYLVGFVLSQRYGGQNESTVNACGWAVELSFLLAYLPVARAIYWY